MSAHRFFIANALSESPLGDSLMVAPMSADDLHHARDVLRITSGETIEVVEPPGSVVALRVACYTDEGIVGSVVQRVGSIVSEPRLTLVQGVAKGDKMDAIVRQTVEVGVTAIVPVLFERSVVRLDERKRIERATRWSRIAESAAKQSHRVCIPAVLAPVDAGDLSRVLADVDRVVVLWECQEGVTLANALQSSASDTHVALVVGPEGGLTAAEVDALTGAGAIAASLGPNILRTETAAVVAVALAADALRSRS